MAFKIKNLLFVLCVFGFVSLAHADTAAEQMKKKVSGIQPTLEGWCSKEKALEFIDLILEVKPKVCVEIGVFGGSSIFPVASALKFLDNGFVVAIDPWDRVECIKYFHPTKDKANFKWWNEVNLDRVYTSFYNMLRRFELEEYCVVMRTTSEKAASVIGTIDILYIDGNHNEAATVADVELYLPKIRSGGYIWLNDALWEDRQMAIELILEECDIVKLIEDGNCILFNKR